MSDEPGRGHFVELPEESPPSESDAVAGEGGSPTQNDSSAFRKNRNFYRLYSVRRILWPSKVLQGM
ncbi:hypothetical protein LE98_004420 [Salmonella enterica subsp. enterica]|nr:hypothetical protein [Salmonella enterica subsp. enterica]